MLLTMMSYSPPDPLVLGALLMKQVLPAQTSLLHFASSLYPYLSELAYRYKTYCQYNITRLELNFDHLPLLTAIELLCEI